MTSATPPYGVNSCFEIDTMHALARLRLGRATSLREKLINALKSANPTESLKELDQNAEQLGAFELVVYVYALLHQPFVADQYELLSRCLLKLAYRLFSIKTISEEKWATLLELLYQGPQLPELAKVLYESRIPENDEVSADFCFDTWNRLGSILNLNNLIDIQAFKKVFIGSIVPRFIDDKTLTAEKCFQSIVFVECMCAGGIDAEVRIKEDECHLFILQAIAKSELSKKVTVIFEKFDSLFGDDQAKMQSLLCAQFSIRALEWVHHILVKPLQAPVLLDSSFVLGVLANPVKAASVKRSIVQELIKNYKSLDLSLAQKILACEGLKTQISQEIPDQLYTIIFNKDWIFDEILTNAHKTTDFKPQYLRHIQQLLAVCPPSHLEIAKAKCILAIKRALEDLMQRPCQHEDIEQPHAKVMQAIEEACDYIIHEIKNI